jgi:hypothetical protein
MRLRSGVIGETQMTKAQPEQLLPRNDRIRKAAKIIDENCGRKVGGCTDSIVNMLDWQDWWCAGMNTLRRTGSKEARRTDRQVAAWLDKGVRLLNRLSSWPLGFENFREDVRRWARLYEDDEEERRKWVRLTSVQHAKEKRVAAEAALHLCDEFAIKPTTTKDGAFCALAAVMWGDETADLQKHCIEVLAPGYRTFLARRSAESGQK